MFLRFILYHGTLHKCKKYYAFTVLLISVLVIFEFHGYFFITHKNSDSQSVIKMENDSSLLVPTIEIGNGSSSLVPTIEIGNGSSLEVSLIYEDRSKTLIGECNHSQTSVFNIETHAPSSLARAYPWLKAAIYPVESQSLMYCAVPKIASKTLVSLMMYVYIRDIIDRLSNNSSNININRIQSEQHINIPKLTEQLQKV